MLWQPSLSSPERESSRRGAGGEGGTLDTMVAYRKTLLPLATALVLLGGAAALPVQAQDDGQPEIYYPFTALDGEQETAGGAEDGYGDFSATLKVEEGKMCYMLSVGEIGEPTAAHLHEGKRGEDGAPVVTLEVTGPKGENCVDVDAALLKKIGGKPANYYVNVHTAKFPAGAVRGQLQN